MKKGLVTLAITGVILLRGEIPASGDVTGHGNKVEASDERIERIADALAPRPADGRSVVTNRSKVLRGAGSGRRAARSRAAAPPCLSGGGGTWSSDPHDGGATWQPMPGCPPAASAGARRSSSSAPPPPTPADAAAQVWYWETILPDPSLATSPPDGAITGLDLYLSIGGPQNLTFDVPALGYAVNLEVSSVYDIDWGDPRPDDSPRGQAVTRDHPTQGGPYPTGDLRHQYIDRGQVTITVTQKWTGRWSAAGESGTIADRLVTTTSRTIPVQEIQAVITG